MRARRKNANKKRLMGAKLNGQVNDAKDDGGRDGSRGHLAPGATGFFAPVLVGDVGTSAPRRLARACRNLGSTVCPSLAHPGAPTTPPRPRPRSRLSYPAAGPMVPIGPPSREGSFPSRLGEWTTISRGSSG